ncbi:MAG: hypothetical protein SVN78_02115 [Deferribacterota bacterium]|nr:hypothetical protein [Deferribacterota bacterium]
MLKRLFLTVCAFSLLTTGILFADAKDYLAPEGSTFTFQVTAKGDNGGRTPILEPMDVDNYTETHTVKGIVSIYPKGKEGKELTDYEKYNASHIQITRPKVYDVVTNWYYAIVDNSLALYYQENSKGDREAYFHPEQFIFVHFPLEKGWSFKSKDETPFYLNLTETGISLASSYESKNYKKDNGVIETKIEAKKTVKTPAGTFECYPVTFVLKTDTGSFITAADTKITTTRCWAPDLGYFVTEDTHLFMDAMTNSEATIHKELTSYKLAK